ncbi:MAG: flagellar biosynthesis protein FlhB [Planctomycetaceae bacterium]|nr:flagellar biosynthesis protein FlhB [Planctomycetaceae bacterium]
MPEQSGDKTYDATPHRRQQAREQGQVAFSQDLGSAALLLVGAGVLMVWGRGVCEGVAAYLAFQLRTVGTLQADPGAFVEHSHALMRQLATWLLPILGVLMLAGALSSVLQFGFLFLPEKLQFDWSRMSPLAGLKRIFSLQGAMRLGFGLFKVAIVATVAGVLLYRRRDEVLLASQMSVPVLAKFTVELVLSTALWTGAALFVLAILDYAFQKWKHEQDLKMTHQEVREEMKNLQGDPQVIARRKQIQRQMALNRIGDKVPMADVVVTNPTELAVAIQYDPQTMAAPVVVAKGAGVIAQRIRRLALENNIPVVERKPLARLLYKEVDVGRPVPDQSYAAVAEVLAYVYKLKGKKMPTPAAA